MANAEMAHADKRLNLISKKSKSIGFPFINKQ